MGEDRPAGSGPGPAPQRLWRLLNTQRSFDPRTGRIACAILAAISIGDAFLRDDPSHPEFFWIRSLIGIYGGVGVVGMGRFTFRLVRLYTLGFALVLPLGVGWICAAVGTPGSELALTAACTFVAIVFLQTGADVLAGVVMVSAVHAVIVLALPPRHVPVGSVVITLLTAVAAGTATALILVGYRARLEESLDWWRGACERERAALRAKSEFLSTMSHELRSPLHVIVGYVDLLRDELDGELAHPLGRIRDSALDLLQLVEHTLQAARLESGKLRLVVDEVDCASVFRDLAENVATLPEGKKGVPVRWRVPTTLPPIRLDRLKLTEIVQNLVSNALKYTTNGGVDVEVTMEGDTLRVAVRDTGPGIAADGLERIFEMFERIEEGAACRPGVGLGLYIVHGLVALMGGRIAVESVVGAGSCFTVWLPCRSDVAAAAA